MTRISKKPHIPRIPGSPDSDSIAHDVFRRGELALASCRDVKAAMLTMIEENNEIARAGRVISRRLAESRKTGRTQP